MYSLCTSLYGEGGGLYTALTSLLLSTLYLSLLILHLRNSSRASLLLYLSLLLATQVFKNSKKCFVSTQFHPSLKNVLGR